MKSRRRNYLLDRRGFWRHGGKPECWAFLCFLGTSLLRNTQLLPARENTGGDHMNLIQAFFDLRNKLIFRECGSDSWRLWFLIEYCVPLYLHHDVSCFISLHLRFLLLHLYPWRPRPRYHGLQAFPTSRGATSITFKYSKATTRYWSNNLSLTHTHTHTQTTWSDLLM